MSQALVIKSTRTEPLGYRSIRSQLGTSFHMVMGNVKKLMLLTMLPRLPRKYSVSYEPAENQ